MANSYHKHVSALLSKAGITPNGPEPHDPQVHDDQFYKWVMANGSLGLGESYMEGLWDCDALDDFFFRLLRAELEKVAPRSLSQVLRYLQARIFNLQSKGRATDNATQHYNLGNEFFRAMLDPRMVYTCGYWEHAQSLAEAQEHKLALTCQKLHLEPGMNVLDIGCGWGSFVRYVAEHYDVSATGLNVSQPQLKEARRQTQGLPVDFLDKDYRNLSKQDGPYDRLVSLGMVEHVGKQNFEAFFKAARRVLHKDGIFLLHTIGSNKSSKTTDPWLDRYIFKNSLIPSLKQLSEAMEGRFVIEDIHNFGIYYDHTLMAWYQNFEAYYKAHKERISNRFYRMWRYYLLCCAGTFRSRKNQLWQLVLSPYGCLGGYTPVRNHASGGA
jgi:cyclopropane-fatty-acyl-phospholipid synthase